MPRRKYVPPPTVLPSTSLPGIKDKAIAEPLKAVMSQLNAVSKHIRSNVTLPDQATPQGPTDVTSVIDNGLFRVAFKADRSGPIILAYRIYRTVLVNGIGSTDPAQSTCIASIAAVSDDVDIVYQFQDQDVASGTFSLVSPGDVRYWVRSFDDRGIPSSYVPAAPISQTAPVGYWELGGLIANLQTQFGISTYLLSDVANSTTSYANVTGLSFAIFDTGIYEFEIVIPYTAAAATTGSRWSINCSDPATMLNYVAEWTLTATTQSVNYSAAYDDPATANASSLTAGNVAILRGVIKLTNGGTVQVRFASEVGGSAITAKAGARATVRRIV